MLDSCSRTSSARRSRRWSSCSRARPRPVRVMRRSRQPSRQTIAKVPQAAHVAGLIPHTLNDRQVSADGKTVYEIVALDLAPDDSPLALEPVKDALTPTPGVTASLAGGPAFYGDIQVLSENDLRRSEFISLPLAALALLLVFGTAIGAGIPIATGGTAVVDRPGGDFRCCPADAAVDLRAEPGHPPRPRPGCRLRPAHDQPIPRRAGHARSAPPEGRAEPPTCDQRSRGDDRRHRRPGGLLQRPDRSARADRADPVRVHGSALCGHRRRDRRRTRRDLGPDASAGRSRRAGPARRPLRHPPPSTGDGPP